MTPIPLVERKNARSLDPAINVLYEMGILKYGLSKLKVFAEVF